MEKIAAVPPMILVGLLGIRICARNSYYDPNTGRNSSVARSFHVSLRPLLALFIRNRLALSPVARLRSDMCDQARKQQRPAMPKPWSKVQHERQPGRRLTRHMQTTV